MINITRQKFIELISLAYEQGWSGCIELKSEYAEQIVREFEENSSSTYSTITVSTPDMYDSEYFLGHYYYYGNNAPIQTIMVDNSNEEIF
jgi:hypothetical protein